MATSKTLTPTNETIQIPAMTDAPDASVFSNCIDKEADAINALNSKLATELASKQYVFSTNSSYTLAEQVLAFCENHRGESNYTASFFMSASNAPSDIPANSNTWKYAFGEVRIRISPLSGGIDGVIILYAFSANQMAIRYIANSVVSSEWKVFS